VEDGLDWLVVVEEEHSEVVLAGFVIDQDPGPGTVVEDGEEVRLVVSLGPPPRTVPDLFNRTVAEARKDIAERELAFGRTEQLHVEDVAEGRVISWSVEGADRPAEVPKGSEVDLVVSLGPAPREVPDLAGAPAEEATAALDALGLVVAVAEDFSSTVDAGRVIATTPEEGTTLARGATVQVVVSRGPDLVRVPDLSAMTESEAIAALRAAGLVAGDANGPAGGDVFASEPRAGSSVERGTRVDLFRR
jgi:serine/threonine-protein kinase